MTKVMSQVKAMIVHQESGVGALTKIMDHLVAGIPVIANTLAARSFFDHNGVYLYDTSEQLLDFIMKDDFPPPLLPFPPDDFEKIMAEVIFNLAR
ncbi:MAG: hypothetical protein IPH04_13895 [Saprospirales bacterium]|nr:hypothetical protein [Saprospirales bacterium]